MLMRITKLCLPLALALTLSGCFVPFVAVVGGAAAGGSLIYDKRSIKTISHDSDTTRIAQIAINQDPQLSGRSHVSVATFNHIVLMVGQAQTPELRDRAYQLVQQAPYVSRIYNEVVVSPPTSMVQRTNDTWLTSKVRSALLAEPGLRSSQIKVVTEESVVYLMGVVTQPQAEQSINIARRISGVIKVVTVFQYQGGVIVS